MNRLLIAGALAVSIHVVAFRWGYSWSRPTLLMPQDRSVSIHLVTFRPTRKQPDEARVATVHPRPKPASPEPKPRPKPKPVKKKVASMAPVIEPPEPAPEIASDTPAADSIASVNAPVPEMAIVSKDRPVGAAETAPEEKTAPKEEAGALLRVSVPRYDINPSPVYPPLAIRRNYEGVVLLDVRVTPTGEVADIHLAESSGFHVLDRRAMTTVKRWRFKPAFKGTQPVESWVRVPIRFELH